MNESSILFSVVIPVYNSEDYIEQLLRHFVTQNNNRFEVIVSTHLNTENIHNHFLVNATACMDGKRYCNTKHDRYMMMHTSNELCRQYNLTVIDEKTRNTKSRGQFRNEQSLREKIKTDIDEIIRTSLTVTQLFNSWNLRAMILR